MSAHHEHGPAGRRSFERPSARPAGVRPLLTPGQMSVDYEHRVDFDRLREYRLGRAKAALEASECGAFLLFDFYNIRYTTQTWIGGADRKSTRLNSSHVRISYAVFCLKKKKTHYATEACS